MNIAACGTVLNDNNLQVVYFFDHFEVSIHTFNLERFVKRIWEEKRKLK